MTDLFALVNEQNFDIKDFLTIYYDFTFKGKKTVCPFHGDDEKNPNFSYSPKLNAMKCFVCDASGDLIKFVSEYKKISKLEACCEILDLAKIPYEKPSSTQEMTQEQKEELKQAQEEQKKQNQLKQQKKQKEIQTLKNKAIKEMTPKAAAFQECLEADLFNYNELITSMIYKNDSPTFIQWLDLYLGYDLKHESMVILNRIQDEKKTCYNLKHRQKYVWNKDKKEHTTERVPGKWISNIDATTFPFPYNYFLHKKSEADNRVFLVEGEKDALNLLSYDLNVLTLGGVASSWEEHKELLKDMTVFIWFDNDNAGYENAIIRYNEIKDITKEVFIVMFYHINNAFEYKYDITDYLFEKKFKTKEEILHSIAYSSYKLSTSLIEDMEEWTEKDLSQYYFIEPLKTFQDIKKEWAETSVHGFAKQIPFVKGTKDIKDLSLFYESFKETRKDSGFSKAKQEILQEVLPKFAKEKEVQLDDLVDKFDQMFNNYEKLHRYYSQTNMSDIREAFMQMAKNTDNTFAKFNKKLCVWTGKYYHILDDQEDDLEGFVIRDFMPLSRVDHKKITAQNVDTVLKDVLYHAPSLNEIKKYELDVRRINFLNGTVKITKNGKYSFKGIHSKKDAVTNILEFDYDPNAKAPKWRKFLNRVIPNKDDQKTLMEFIGYCFLPSHDYESFLLLHGSTGANGKSVIMDVIRRFFGKENISSLQLQDFEGHKLHGIANKIINIGTEIDADNLKNGQLTTLKALTAPEDTIEIDPKNKDGYTLEAEQKPKLIFSANKKPKSGLDDAVFRRMLLITFDSEIMDDEKIRGLSRRFNDEMAGILNLALKHLEQLIKNGKFTKSQNMKEQLQSYKESIDPLRTFTKDCLILDEKVMIPKRYLYAVYKTYVSEKGNHALSEIKFWTKLREDLKIKTDGDQIEVNDLEELGKRPRFVKGIKCLDEDIISFEFKPGKEVLTKNINYSIEHKLPLISEE